MMSMLGLSQGRISRLGSVFSQLMNVLFLNGHPKESISGRAYREGIIGGDPKWAKVAARIDKVFFWEYAHTQSAHFGDVVYSRSILELTSQSRIDGALRLHDA